MSKPDGRAAPVISRLRLTDFRNYRSADITFSASLVALAGANGAGKTNILEALSLLTPGRGLRRAALAQMVRSGANGFIVLADVETPTGPCLLATALNDVEKSRECRIDRVPVASANRFLDHLAFLWLTPDQDGLFRGSPGDRRRFLDRLVLALDGEHGTRASRYEVAIRHRNRLLDEQGSNARWLDAVELEVVELGIALSAARRETVGHLARLMQEDALAIAPFPHAQMTLSGDLEARLNTEPAGAVEDWFLRSLRDGRSRDRAAGRTLTGPHLSDLSVIHGPKGEPAQSCSTGEQKALLLGMVLAQARLVAALRGAPPLLLLDEIAAHLDEARRAALYQMLAALGSQAFMTGTDTSLFEALPEGGACYRVENGVVEG